MVPSNVPSNAASQPHCTDSQVAYPPPVSCANGALADYQEAMNTGKTFGAPLNLIPNALLILYTSTVASQTSANPTILVPSHPCPSEEYSGSTCPNGWFCRPTHTPAPVCTCGRELSCAEHNQGWYCTPTPTSTSDNFVTSLTSLPTSNPTGNSLLASSSCMPVLTSSSSTASLVNTGSTLSVPTSSYPQ